MEEGEEYQIPPSPSTAESACQRWGGGEGKGRGVWLISKEYVLSL